MQVLRSHVMVRIGGGWDTLESYLDRHDPCRCNSKGKNLFVRQLMLDDKRDIGLYMWPIASRCRYSSVDLSFTAILYSIFFFRQLPLEFTELNQNRPHVRK